MKKIIQNIFLAVFFAAVYAGIAFSQETNDSISFEEISIGSEINLGTWTFDNDGKVKPVVWLVAEKYMEDKSLLLVSKYVIENMSFSNETNNASGTDNIIVEINWNSSKIREWLNSFFYEHAFTKEDKGHIMLETVSSGINPKYKKDIGPDVQDHLFLLSIAEYEKFSNIIKSIKGRKGPLAKATPYLNPNIKTFLGYPWFWLRTSGKDYKNVASVSPIGRINYRGYSYMEKGGVRPALRYSINALPKNAATAK